MENIYEIDWDTSHLVDIEYDVFHVPYEDNNFLGSEILDDFEFEHPKEILFRGDFSVLNKVDFLVNDLLAPILSKKMIRILESIGSFPHRTISCGIIDFKISPDDSFENFEKSILKPETEVNREYEILHILEHLDVLDYEKSDIIMSKIDPSEVSKIRKYVFKEPTDGFPPIFRIKEIFTPLFITEKVKQEFESTGIQGIKYKKL